MNDIEKFIEIKIKELQKQMLEEYNYFSTKINYKPKEINWLAVIKESIY